MIPMIAKKVADTFLHNQNQFAQGGLLLMLVGGAAAYFKAIPGKIYESFLHLFSMTVTITDDSKAFLWFKWWFQEHERSKKIRHIDVITPKAPGGVKAMFFPAPGNHWFMYKGRPFRMSFTRTEGDKQGMRETRPEALTLRVVGRDQKFLREFILDVKAKYDAANKDVPRLYVWVRMHTYWDTLTVSLRPWESVILPADVKEDLVRDIREFQSSKSWYDRTGLPYHRSYLLHGPPGTGKTSTLLGLASLLKMSIYLLKLAGLDDDSLVQALHNVPDNAMVVLEDVDCLNNKRASLKKSGKPSMKHPEGRKKKEDEKKSGGLTLSGLLNALDGIETPAGSLFFMTTNLIDSLDAALLRPGRVDKKIYLGPATLAQKLEMYERFFPFDPGFPGIELGHAEAYVREHPELKTMAEFQEALKIKRGGA